MKVATTDAEWSCVCPTAGEFLAWNAGTGCAGTCTANCATCYSAAASGDTCLTCADTYYDNSDSYIFYCN